MKIINWILMIILGITFVILGSLIIYTSTMGTSIIIYWVLILICIAWIFYFSRKFYRSYKEEKKILEIARDPEKLYQKLKENKIIIDDGREVDITLNEDPATGKKVLDIKLGKKVEQDWRKKFEVTPIKKKTDEKKPLPKENINKAPQKGIPQPKKPKTKDLNTSSSSSF